MDTMDINVPGRQRGLPIPNKRYATKGDELLQGLQEFLVVKPYGYTDNGMFLILGLCPKTLVELGQPVIDRAVAWGRENNLRFSTKNTRFFM